MSRSVAQVRATSQAPPLWATLLLLGFLAVCTLGFGELGVWQLHRRAWKLDLIARVEARVHASPVEAPGPPAWPSITEQSTAYRRVRVQGVFLNGRETLVQALTELGAGYWVLTPLATPRGFTVLVNRGFVPPELKDPASRPHGQIAGTTEVTGLLRVSEPRGRFLLPNDPAHALWYSRDVQAIAEAHGLTRVAPYFVDAEAAGPADGPTGGLTVISFPNSHLAYAITWFTLALLSAGAGAGLIWMKLSRRGARSARETGRVELGPGN